MWLRGLGRKRSPDINHIMNWEFPAHDVTLDCPLEVSNMQNNLLLKLFSHAIKFFGTDDEFPVARKPFSLLSALLKVNSLMQSVKKTPAGWECSSETGSIAVEHKTWAQSPGERERERLRESETQAPISCHPDQLGTVFPSTRRYLAIFRDSFSCHNQRLGYTCIRWTEAMDIAKYLTVLHSITLYYKELSRPKYPEHKSRETTIQTIQCNLTCTPLPNQSS
jgi:hypothetical protein